MRNDRTKNQPNKEIQRMPTLHGINDDVIHGTEISAIIFIVV